jgi:DNA modification methylase
MVFTDPPYNVNYSGRGKSTSNTIKNDNIGEAEFRTMLTAWFKSYQMALKHDGALYTCYTSRTHREFEDALNANEFEVRNQIIWVKKVASMGWGDYRWKHEPMLYCHKKDGKTEFFGDRKQYTEWTEEPSDAQLLSELRAMVKRDEAGESTVWRLHREMKYDHPTQKPLKLVSIAIRNSSKRDDIVLDLFGGSGSTLIASDQLNRICYTMELDPKYVDTIIKRYEKTTGIKAKKL